MKKILAFLMACMLLMSIAPAFAEEGYTPVSPSVTDNGGLKHSLKLTEDGATTVPADITYSFKNIAGPFVESPAGISEGKIGMMVTGVPSIADITYTSEDAFTDKVCEKDIVITWGTEENPVQFKEPGVYYWTVEKSRSFDASGSVSADKMPSNVRMNDKLYVVVTADDNGLKVSNIMLVQDEDNKGNIEDVFPVSTVNLSLGKEVAGSQASKNQYFKFSVSVTVPSGYSRATYKIKDANTSIPETAYNAPLSEEQVVTEITAIGGTQETVELWLKHGQKVEILGLPYGTAVSIGEEAEGFAITSNTTVGTQSTAGKETVSIDAMEADTEVLYTNTKDAQVPTGIDLQTGAPIMGLLAAAALMVLLFVGKRKEAAE